MSQSIKPPNMGDHDVSPTRSEKLATLESRIIIPFCITAITIVMVVLLKNHIDRLKVLAVYLLFLVFYAAYISSRVKKSLIPYIFPCVFVYIELTTPIATTFFYIFRTILPGSPAQDPTFFNALVEAFFGSGLMEELMKALPALIGLCLALRSTTSSAPASRYLDLVRCSTPIEGILVGLAAGAGFAYVETFYQVAPDRALYVSTPDSFGAGFDGLVLLFQKLRQGVIGHMAWAGISGFFIGLSARYPRSMLILLLTGWLSSAALHTLWNLSPYLGDVGRWIKNGLSLLVFVVCFFRAKRLDAPTAASDSAS
jgi:RsiW-degrading membrane proteinase PrsW (M82 family)